VLASILVPRLLLNLDWHDIVFDRRADRRGARARLFVLFGLLPPTQLFRPDPADRYGLQIGDRPGAACAAR